jgi:hypothetical protein
VTPTHNLASRRDEYPYLDGQQMGMQHGCLRRCHTGAGSAGCGTSELLEVLMTTRGHFGRSTGLVTLANCRSAWAAAMFLLAFATGAALAFAAVVDRVATGATVGSVVAAGGGRTTGRRHRWLEQMAKPAEVKRRT